jgi:hypothetical protein
MRLRLLIRLAAPLSALVFLACGGDDLVLPPDGSPSETGPAQLEMVRGNGQVGLAGTPLDSQVVVQLVDNSGDGVPGQSVTWIIATGGGIANPVTATTDGDGYASATWTLGSPGPNSLSAVVAGIGEVTFRATANPAGGGPGTVPSASASTLSADPSSIQVGTGTSTIRVTVRDAAGAPVPGAVVTLSATGSGNALTQPSAPTGSDGVATGTLNSTIAGTKDVSAIVNGTVQLNQTAQVFVEVAPPSRIRPVEGDHQSARAGTSVRVPPAVRVTNTLGQPVAGFGVTFVVTEGGGTVTGASQVTNAAGIARVGSWTLGSPGRNRLEAQAGSLQGSPVVFQATAREQPPPPPPPPPPTTGEPDHFVFRVPPHDVRKDEWFTIEVAILDAAGNVVPLNGTQIYVGLLKEGNIHPSNTLLAGDRFIDTQNGVSVFTLRIKQEGRYRFKARSDYLPKHLGPYGPELLSNVFQVH